MKRLILMRSCPGGGKSFLAAQLKTSYEAEGLTVVLHSTDDFWMVDGVYKFNKNAVGYWRMVNQQNAERSLLDGINIVLVDNTNTTLKECRPYAKMALAAGYEVQFVEPDTPWAKDADELFRRNQHGVPMDVIRAMLSRYQDTDNIGMSLAIEFGGSYDPETKTVKG